MGAGDRMRRGCIRDAILLAISLAVPALIPSLARAGDPESSPIGSLFERRHWHELAEARGLPDHVNCDTTWLGHSLALHTDAQGTVNPDNVFTGVYRPKSPPDPLNVMWDWDDLTGVDNSNQGWRPIRRAYSITGGLALPDGPFWPTARTWWAIDYGNQVNYTGVYGLGQPSASRSPGLTGVWHRDRGNAVGSLVGWAPLSGTASAWCGLRAHGDLSERELPPPSGTGNYFNQTAVEFNGENGGGTGTDKNFPGYGSQWDQMLYRDVALTPGQALHLTFKLRTRMSTGRETRAGRETGCFFSDYSLVGGNPNFVSASAAGSNAPIDSFTVYAGSPVGATAVSAHDVVYPVSDDVHRFLSELIQIWGQGSTYAAGPVFELYGAVGNVPAGAGSTTVDVTLSAADVSKILSTPRNNGAVRLVFRVHTNSAYADDDDRGYSSNGEGAAIVDDVFVNGSLLGDFESPDGTAPNTIDNDPSRSPLLYWKSTGKPPRVMPHVEDVHAVPFDDPSGPTANPYSFSNMTSNVMVFGDAENNDAAGYMSAPSSIGGEDGAFQEETMDAVVSPTINLVAGAGPNSMGLTSADLAAITNGGDLVLAYDVYGASCDLYGLDANGWTVGVQSYPALQRNGVACWGEMRFAPVQFYSPDNASGQHIVSLTKYDLIRTSKANGIPDSIRIFLGKNEQCFRFGVNVSCSSTHGLYFDNVALGFVRPSVCQSQSNVVSVGRIDVEPIDWYHDTFPANDDDKYPGTPEFDTLATYIKTGRNIAQALTAETRFDVPGDTVLVSARGAGMRTDMVFRILPGPGNYQIISGRTFPPAASQVLLARPDNQHVAAAPGDGGFWGEYLADPGPFGSPGAHYGGLRWDPLSWNSARCDTAEWNIFLIAGVSSGMRPGIWASMYHEGDPKFATLGIIKFKCFVIDTTKAASCSPSLDNMSCNGVLPAWLTAVPQSRTGWDGLATTREFTKIIPDGLLTPGSHVQYFFRKSSLADPVAFAMCPDTTRVFPQMGEDSWDAHRWQQFSVLPDRYKTPEYGGAGSACMLTLDISDRSGDERAWVAVMDTVGGTARSHWGVHNGWHARGDERYAEQTVAQMPTLPRLQNQQPGSAWDLYSVRGGEDVYERAGGIGNRLANTSGLGFATGKSSRIGPTRLMLRTYYRTIALLSGTLGQGVLGRRIGNSEDDEAMLSDFVSQPAGTVRPRGLLAHGADFVSGEYNLYHPGGQTFVQTTFGARIVQAHYFDLVNVTEQCIDLNTSALSTGSEGQFGLSYFGAADVLAPAPGSGAEIGEAESYQTFPPAFLGPYTAAIRKDPVPARNWSTFVTGYGIQDELDRYCESSQGRLIHEDLELANMFGSLCALTGAPSDLLDVPHTGGPGVARGFLRTLGNPSPSGFASIEFGLPHASRVTLEIYDITGRVVRHLVERVFPAGTHTARWDERDDAGRPVARGVYFLRLRGRDDPLVRAEKLTIVH